MSKFIPVKANPWYREPWPWLLAMGPLLVVIASVVSAWIAIKGSDGLVSEDYYLQGLAAQETISRSEKAKALGLAASLQLTPESLDVQLLAGAAGYQAPLALHVTLSHPTRAGVAQTLLIPRQGSGYFGKYEIPASGHWLILIEDDAKTWRMIGSVLLPADGAIVIGQLPTEARHP